MHCRTVSRIPNLYPPDARSTAFSTPKLTIKKNLPFCPLGTKLTLVENYCFTKINVLSYTARPEDFKVLLDALMMGLELVTLCPSR